MCNPFFYLPIPKGVYSLPKKLLINKFFFFFFWGGVKTFLSFEREGDPKPRRPALVVSTVGVVVHAVVHCTALLLLQGAGIISTGLFIT